MTVRGIVAAMAVMALMAGGTSLAQAASTATGVASATVVRPLTVAALADMDFGTIAHAPGRGGTVTLNPGTTGASFGDGASAGCTGSACATAHAARFAVNGEPQRSYAIQLPAVIIATGTATDPGALAPPLTIAGLVLRTNGGTLQPRLDAGGADQFEVGGTITLPADLPPARYRASFAVIVRYI